MPPTTTWKPKFDLEVLHLGEIEVGRVCRRGGRKDRPRWLFNLNSHGAFWRDEATVDQCKAAVEDKLREWLEQAGLA